MKMSIQPGTNVAKDGNGVLPGNYRTMFNGRRQYFSQPMNVRKFSDVRQTERNITEAL
jgi:hypothetical protein